MTPPGLHHPRAPPKGGRASSRRRRGTTSATSSSSTTGPTPTRSARCSRPASSRTPTPALRAPCSPTGSRARDRRRADRPVRSPVPRVLHRRQRAARRRGGHDLPVHLGRPGLRARARLDPGLPEEARRDLDDAHVRPGVRGRPGVAAGRAIGGTLLRATAGDRRGDGDARARDARRAAPQRAADRQRPPLPAARRRPPRRPAGPRARARGQPRPQRLHDLGGRRHAELLAAPSEEHDALAPVKVGRGYRFTFAYTVDDLGDRQGDRDGPVDDRRAWRASTSRRPLHRRRARASPRPLRRHLADRRGGDRGGLARGAARSTAAVRPRTTRSPPGRRWGPAAAPSTCTGSPT